MDLIKNLNLGTVAEIVITVAIVYALTQAIKQTKIDNKWLPWISMLLGIFSGLIAVIVTGDHNFLTSGFMGFIVGGFTSGLFDGFSAFVSKAEKELEAVKTVFPDDLMSRIYSSDHGNNGQGKEIKDETNQKNGGETK